MNCRYCGGVYAATERTCGGCGSPKTVVQTFLDVPAAPGHWSHSMTETVQRVAIGTGIVGVAAVLLATIGFTTLSTLAVFLWVLLLSPAGLGMGAWQSSIGDFPERVRNCIIAVLLWVGILISMLLVIGLTVAS